MSKKIIILIFSVLLIGKYSMGQNSTSTQKEPFTLSITEKMAFSTVRIEVNTENGTGVGTGFFFNFFQTSKTSVPVIVTNKHVIKGAKQGTFILTNSNPDGSPSIKDHISIILNDFEKYWIFHPDKNVDLAIMPIAPLLVEAKNKGFKPFYIPLEKSLIPSKSQLKELSPAEEILMIGYPIGIWDEINNYPIFRKGITATHPFYNYNGNPEFLIDAACFPGSSGSPVFLANIGNYVDKKGNTVIATRIYFLGVLYAGPQYTTTGKVIVIDIPTKKEILSVTRIPTNLGLVIKSEKLLDFEKILQDIMNKK